MSKELETLEILIETIRMFGKNQIGLDRFEEKYKIIKQALQQLESIDNANSKKALIDLEKLGKYELKQDCLVGDLIVYDTIKNYILKSQEQEKENAKYRQLEKELSCPLEILYKIQKRDYIYVRNKKKYVNAIILNRKNNFIVVSDDELGMINRFNVSLSDYKKSWFLKKDKSE